MGTELNPTPAGKDRSFLPFLAHLVEIGMLSALECLL